MYGAKIASGLVVPLFRRGMRAGICCFFRRAPRRFTAAERRLGKAAAELIALALDKAPEARRDRAEVERYRPLLEESDQIFFYEHDTNFIIRYVSPSIEKILGFSPAERIGRPASEVSAGHPSYAQALAENEAAFKDGRMRPPYVIWVKHKDGRSVPLEAFEVPYLRDGQVAGMRGFARDVSAWCDAQQKLEQHSSFLNALVQNSPLGIVVLDSSQQVEMCNPAFERIFQYRNAELVGRKLDEMIVPKGSEMQARSLSQRVFAGETVHTTARRQRKDGELVEVELHAVPLRVDGDGICAYAMYQDVTEFKQAAAALRILAGQLLSAQDEERRRLARELHDTTAQSLVALTMSLAALKESASPALGEQHRKALTESAQLAEECAKEIRTFSYLLHPPLLDEAGLRAAIEWYVSGFSARSGVEIELDLCAEPVRLPREAALALFRVVQESLSNVRRHSGSRSARITLHQAQDQVLLEISDQGRGLSGRPTDPGIAYGMGIAGMRERLEQFGGRLEIVSESGTTVRAKLPAGVVAC